MWDFNIHRARYVVASQTRSEASWGTLNVRTKASKTNALSTRQVTFANYWRVRSICTYLMKVATIEFLCAVTRTAVDWNNCSFEYVKMAHQRRMWATAVLYISHEASQSSQSTTDISTSLGGHMLFAFKSLGLELPWTDLWGCSLGPLSTPGYRNIFNKVMYYTTIYVSVARAGPRFGKGGGFIRKSWDASPPLRFTGKPRYRRSVGQLPAEAGGVLHIILHDV